MNLKKNDKVMVIKGKEKGKISKIENVLNYKNAVILAGLNRFKKHLKPSKKNPHGGIIDINLAVKRDNVILVCPRCEKPTRISHSIINDKKIRICKKCRESVDSI